MLIFLIYGTHQISTDPLGDGRRSLIFLLEKATCRIKKDLKLALNVLCWFYEHGALFLRI